MKTAILLLKCIGLLLGIASNAYSEDRPVYYAVSIIQLIAHPEPYLDRHIYVSGYLSSSGYLYLTDDFASIQDASNAVQLDFEANKLTECMWGYVKVQGKFSRAQFHKIIEITKVYNTAKREHCRIESVLK